MLKAVTHIGLMTTDQNAALAFYTEKLGFEIRADMTMGDFRWLTVGLKGQPELEFVLMPTSAGPNLSAEDAATIRGLLSRGAISGHVITTDDIQATYSDLKGKDVEFVFPPTPRDYGVIEAQFKDNSGNWWVLTQRTGGGWG